VGRRVLTKADVEAAREAGLLELGPRDVLTAAARELAERVGVEIRLPSGAAPTAPYVPPPRPAQGAHGGDAQATPPERAVVTAVGRNRPFVLSELTTRISELSGNIEDITQRIVGDYFSTIMMVDLSAVKQFGDFKAQVEGLSREGDYKVLVQHERLFTAMYRV
jgi:ACT domain-containing protein